jgi:hypothetical protein
MSSCSFDVVAIHVNRHASSPLAQDHAAIRGGLTPHVLVQKKAVKSAEKS